MQPLSAAVFRRGQKREFPGTAPPAKDRASAHAGDDADAEEDADLEDVMTLQELQDVLSAPRSGKDYSAAIWRPHLHAAELVKTRKGTAAAIGFSWRRKQYLHVEEAVFLVDRGDLMLFVEHQGVQRLLSVQEAYDLMLTSGVSMDRFLVYSQLSRCGYLLMRHPSRWVLESSQAPADVWADWTTEGLPCPASDAKVASTSGADPGLAVSRDLRTRGTDSSAPGSRAQPGSVSGRTDGLQGEPQAAEGSNRTGATTSHAQGLTQQQSLEKQRNGSAGGPGLGPPASPPQQQQPHKTEDEAPAQLSGQHRGWWKASGPDHPHLQGVPPEWFAQAPRNAVESVATELKAKYPRLRPLGPVPSGPHLTMGSDRATSRAALVFDVYKPGSKVSRNKGSYPPVLYHLAICNSTPPTAQELRNAEDLAAKVRREPGAKPSPVGWGSVDDAILTFFQVGKADLLPLV